MAKKIPLANPQPEILISDLKKFADKIEIIINLLDYFAEKEKDSNLKLKYHAFSQYSNLLKDFPSQLERFTDDQAFVLQEKDATDINGNKIILLPSNTTKYTKLSDFNIAYIKFSDDYKNILQISLEKDELKRFFLVKTIRNKDNDKIEVVPYENPFDITVVKILSAYQQILEKVKDKRLEAQKFSCKQTSNIDPNNPFDRIVNPNNASGILDKFKTNIETEILWTDFAKQYFHPISDLEKNGIIIEEKQISIEDVRKISRKFDENSVKTEEELKNENLYFASAQFKTQISGKREKQVEQVTTSKVLLNEKKITNITERGLSALNSCFDNVVDRFSIGCLIKEAADCLIPPLSCKDILRGIRVDNLTDKISLAFPNQPELIKKVNNEIEKFKKENRKDAVNIDEALDIVEKFIDIEALCDILKLLQQIEFPPKISLKPFPIIDLNSNITLQIDEAILEALVKAICGFIERLLGDLLNCGNLDRFIAAAISRNPNAALSNELNSLIDGRIRNTIDDFAAKIANEACNNISLNSEANIGVLGALNITQNTNFGRNPSDLQRRLFSQQLTASINVPEVASQFFEIKDSSTEQQLLNEIGTFELIKDGDRVSVNRTSDDRRTQILNTISTRKSDEEQRAEKIFSSLSTCDSLKQKISDTLFSTVSLLKPSETLDLFAGQPSQQTVELVNKVAKTTLPEVYNGTDFYTPNALNLFNSFAGVAGLKDLRDQLIALSNLDPTPRNVPRKYCPEDDERINIRERLLSRTLNPEEVKRQLEDDLRKQRDNYNSFINDLTNANKSVQDAINKARCAVNSGKNPDGSSDKNTEKALNNIIDILFNPVKMSFDREIQQYISAVSTTIEKEVVKQKEVEVIKKGKKQKGIDPEWLSLSSSGYEPDNDGKITATISSQNIASFLKNSSNINNVILKNNTINITSSLNEVGLNPYDALKKITGIEIKTPPSPQIPNWKIQHIEKKDNNNKNTYELKLISNGTLISKTGVVSFKKTELYKNLKVKEKYSNIQETRKQYYLNKLLKQISNTLQSNTLQSNTPEKEINKIFENAYTNTIFKQFKNESDAIKNNRLFLKIPLDDRAAKTLNNSEAPILISSIEISPAVNDGCDNGLLNLTKIKKDTKNAYEKIAKEDCEKEQNKQDGTTAQKNPLTKSSLQTAILLNVKLYCIEYLLRALAICDNFNYNKEQLINEVVLDFLTNRIKEDITKLGYYEQFIDEVILLYKNETKQESPVDENEAIKFCIEEVIDKVLHQLAKNTGFKQNKEKLTAKILKTIPAYGTYVDNQQRFSGNVEEKLILEQYIKVPNEVSKYGLLNSDEKYRGIISLSNFSELITNSLSSLNKLTQEQKNAFLSEIKIGIRLCQISLIEYKELKYPAKKDYTIKNNVFNKQDSDLKKIGFARELIEDNSERRKKKYKNYSIIKIANEEMPINMSSIEMLNNAIVKEKIYNYEEMIDKLSNNTECEEFLEYALIGDKIPEILMINAMVSVNTDIMVNMFNATKKSLKELIINLKNAGNYAATTPMQENGGTMAEYENSMSNIGGSGGSGDPNILFWLTIAPVLILRGLAELTDPNIAISSIVVKAAASGLLFPKIGGEGGECEDISLKPGEIKYPGDPINIPYNAVSWPLFFATNIPPTPLGIAFLATEPLLLGLSGNKKLNSKKCSDTNKKVKDITNNKTDTSNSTSDEDCDD